MTDLFDCDTADYWGVDESTGDNAIRGIVELASSCGWIAAHRTGESAGAYILYSDVEPSDLWGIDHNIGGHIHREFFPPSPVIPILWRTGLTDTGLPDARSRVEKFISRAAGRIEQLQRLTSGPSMEYSDDEEEDPQEPLSPTSKQMAMDVLQEIARRAPESTIGIFPTRAGGLVLQSVGNEHTVTVEIPTATDVHVWAKYAGKDVFHREVVHGPEYAADFLIANAK